MDIYVGAYNTICSLGFSADDCFKQIVSNNTGIKVIDDKAFSDGPLPLSRVNTSQLDKEFSAVTDNTEKYTRFEKLMLLSAIKTVNNSGINPKDPKTLFILSTTKGNVELLGSEKTSGERVNLWSSAELLQNYFNNPNRVQVVSNACISGIVAMVIGKRLIQSGNYDNVVVVGADAISKFIVSGFQSFKSLSPQACRPFDRDRYGLTIGEGAASLVLTNKRENSQEQPIKVVDGATSNDANHISGPSRTGEGLFLAIKNTFKNSKLTPDFIQAHGTATPYNDDMESKAIFRSDMDKVPVNSFKGYFGHTLGAAGLLETILGIESLKNNTLIGTLGYTNFGVAENITIADKTCKKELNTMLKLASGFGGCNAALLITKDE